MQMLKFGKLAALSLALAVGVGCSSKGGDASGEGAIDPNAGYGADTGAVDGSYDSNRNEEAALRAITTFYFEFDSSDLKPEAMRALDVHARDLQGNGARVVLEGHADERGTREYNMADRKSTRLNSSHVRISYAVFCLKKKKKQKNK